MIYRKPAKLAAYSFSCCSRKCVYAVQRTITGPNAPAWKGGGSIINNGYEYAYAGIGRKYTGKHRLVMEERLGRRLARAEVVHHINGDKTDNRPENLEVLSLAEHNAKHARVGRDDIAEIIRLRASGVAIKDIASRYHISPCYTSVLSRRTLSSGAPQDHVAV